MISPNWHTPRSRNCTIDIKNVIGRLSSNIYHKRAIFLALTIQANLGRSDRRKNDIINIKRNFSHTLNTVLDTGPYPVNDVVISLKFSP